MSHEILPSLRRTQASYYAAVFLRWFGIALPLALMVLMMQARGMSLLQIGMIMGLHSAVIVVLEIPTGGLADAIGRKPTALLSQVVTLASTVAFLFAFSFALFALAAVLLGTGRALSSGALDAWFVDALLARDPATDLQAPLAQAESLAIAGLALGTLAGGAIPTVWGGGLPADGAAVLTPLALPFLASFAVQLLGLAVVALFIREDRPGGAQGAADGGTHDDAPGDAQSDAQSDAHDAAAVARAGPAATGQTRGFAAIRPIVTSALRAARDDRIVTLVMITTAATGLSVAALETFWQPRFDTLLRDGAGPASPLTFGALMAGAFTVGVIGNLASIPLARRLGRRYALAAALGQLLGGAALVALAWRSGLPAAVGLFWIAYFANALTGSPIATILNEQVPSARRSSTLSVVSLAGYLGAFAGSAGFGALAQHAGIPVVWTVAGAILAASAGFLLAIDRLRQAKASRAPA